MIDELVAAAERDDEDILDEWLAELVRGPGPRVIPGLLSGCCERSPAVVDAIGRAAEACLRAAPTRSFWAIDRSARTRDAKTMSPDRIAWMSASLERGRLGALALASMQRDGFTRAAAIEELAGASPDALVLCLLLIRLNDPVDAIADRAGSLISDLLVRAPVRSVVDSLALIESVHGTVRARTSGVVAAVDELLGRGGPRVRAALVAATAARDPDLRIAAITRLARGFAEHPEVASTLIIGLRDRNPRVRLAVAELVARAGLSPSLVDPLLPMLERDRSPAIRLMGLRWRRRIRDDAALLRACFDRNASVRHYARRYHRGVGGQADYRALALERLGSSDVGELIGALATLSDLGRACDRVRVEPFLAHPVRDVADEARRTFALLDS